MRLVFLVAVLAAFVAVVKLLPWWITVGLVVIAIVVRERLFRAVVGGAVKGLFDSKSRVLRGARVTVHALLPIARPEGSEDTQDRRWFDLDVTLDVPKPRAGDAMTFWDPFDLDLTDVATPPRSMDDDDGAEEKDFVVVHDVKLWADGAPHEIEDKLQGSARLRLVVGVLPGLTKAKFRYYFEDFGDVDFPA